MPHVLLQRQTSFHPRGSASGGKEGPNGASSTLEYYPLSQATCQGSKQQAARREIRISSRSRISQSKTSTTPATRTIICISKNKTLLGADAPFRVQCINHHSLTPPRAKQVPLTLPNPPAHQHQNNTTPDRLLTMMMMLCCCGMVSNQNQPSSRPPKSHTAAKDQSTGRRPRQIKKKRRNPIANTPCCMYFIIIAKKKKNQSAHSHHAVPPRPQ